MAEVSEAELRRLFNTHILPKVATGEVTVIIRKDVIPSPPPSFEPEGTRSQLLAYYDSDGKKVSEAHRYLRKDGKIGASGKPDPKEVLHKGTWHVLELR